MRLLFIVPSNIHKTTAGSRIRYDRLTLGRARLDISIQSIGELTGDDLSSCDVCILSKTFSLESIAIAQAVRASGKIVGMDLFDDYFTQWNDSRLSRFRRWLNLAARECDFALCSTKVVRRIIQHYAPNLPVHVLPDPYPNIDPDVLAPIVSEKLARVQNERVIDILWFGIGSNPTFPVGLQDLAAYSSSLRALASFGFKPQLAILTNKPALKLERLAQLSRLPIDYKIDLWSLDAEREALAKAFACFLPVNGQSFSRAKSLNRALTAISSGAQVLSPGFPLYAELQPAIYADAEELAADAATGKCRICRENVLEISRIVTATSSVTSLSDNLFSFLSDLGSRQSRPTGGLSPIALIYGASQDLPAVRGAKAAGVLSVASPFVGVERAYDIRVEYHSGRRFDVWITPPMKPHLSPALDVKLTAPVKRGKLMMHKVDMGDQHMLSHTPMISPGDRRPIAQETECYRHLLSEVERICRVLFPEFSFALSEINTYPGAPELPSSAAGRP